MSWPPYTESKERRKKEVNHSRLMGGRFNKQGNLHKPRLVLGRRKMSRSPQLPTRTSEVYRET